MIATLTSTEAIAEARLMVAEIAACAATRAGAEAESVASVENAQLRRAGAARSAEFLAAATREAFLHADSQALAADMGAEAAMQEAAGMAEAADTAD
jgi:hypothetical protein